MVNIPVGLQVAQVANARIGSHTFHFLIVPQREGIVVAVGEENGITFILQGHEIILPEVSAGVAMTSVVIVPSLRGHLHRHQQTHRSHNSRKHRLVHRQPLLEQVNQCRHTDAAPDGKGVE